MSLMNKLPRAWESLIHHGWGQGSDRAGYFGCSLWGGTAARLSCPLSPREAGAGLGSALLPTTPAPCHHRRDQGGIWAGRKLCPATWRACVTGPGGRAVARSACCGALQQEICSPVQSHSLPLHEVPSRRCSKPSPSLRGHSRLYYAVSVPCTAPGWILV